MKLEIIGVILSAIILILILIHMFGESSILLEPRTQTMEDDNSFQVCGVNEGNVDEFFNCRWNCNQEEIECQEECDNDPYPGCGVPCIEQETACRDFCDDAYGYSCLNQLHI